ncbi:hypothetical protein ACHHYP_12864 [Achlya hypogyna]|uniref:Secreted protein n=1 Tax=Achlya hypogyna TaxID=1202772 RepID=A0A1V9ZG83_ACHHY|nr:hypothetical protein ACHHYP_12864 [Achlya hypogyna]
MKGALFATALMAAAAPTSASSLRPGRALTQMTCDKDCSDLSTASNVLCEMGRYTSCAYDKVLEGGTYIVHGVGGWFESSSAPPENTGSGSSSGQQTTEPSAQAPSSIAQRDTIHHPAAVLRFSRHPSVAVLQISLHRLAMDCDKDCSDLSTASTVLCEMGKYGTCAYSKVVEGGSYVISGVGNWFVSSSTGSGESASTTHSSSASTSGTAPASTRDPASSNQASTAKKAQKSKKKTSGRPSSSAVPAPAPSATSQPTAEPTAQPTEEPSAQPTVEPTAEPTAAPVRA